MRENSEARSVGIGGRDPNAVDGKLTSEDDMIVIFWKNERGTLEEFHRLSERYDETPAQAFKSWVESYRDDFHKYRPPRLVHEFTFAIMPKEPE